MSVICFGVEKFYKIAESLKSNKNGGDLMWAFAYPEGWETPEGSKYIINCFVNDLYRANQLTYKYQYAENHEDAHFLIESLHFPHSILPYTKIELYKALQSIRYNICANDGTIKDLCDCEKRLDKIIDATADDIISALPDYDKADVWG